MTPIEVIPYWGKLQGHTHATATTVDTCRRLLPTPPSASSTRERLRVAARVLPKWADGAKTRCGQSGRSLRSCPSRRCGGGSSLRKSRGGTSQGSPAGENALLLLLLLLLFLFLPVRVLVLVLGVGVVGFFSLALFPTWIISEAFLSGLTNIESGGNIGGELLLLSRCSSSSFSVCHIDSGGKIGGEEHADAHL